MMVVDVRVHVHTAEVFKEDDRVDAVCQFLC